MRAFFAVLPLLSACTINLASTAVGTDEATLPVVDLASLDLDVGAGDLVVTGSPDATDITVSVEVWRGFGGDDQDDDAMDALRIELRDEGDGVVQASVFFDPEMPLYVADTTVTVPDAMELWLTDGSGDAALSAVAKVCVGDGSGDLRIRDIAGDVLVEDGSGDLEVSSVGGNVEVTDGTGDLLVAGVCGDAGIVDGSGDIVVDDVHGTVSITDGSGDIFVGEVGDVEVVEGGSGDVRIE